MTGRKEGSLLGGRVPFVRSAMELSRCLRRQERRASIVRVGDRLHVMFEEMQSLSPLSLSLWEILASVKRLSFLPEFGELVLLASFPLLSLLLPSFSSLISHAGRIRPARVARALLFIPETDDGERTRRSRSR